MSQTQNDYFQLVGMIASLPEEDRNIIKEVVDAIETILKKYPDHAGAALALVGLTAQMELEKST